jgi:hypothetical protein
MKKVFKSKKRFLAMIGVVAFATVVSIKGFADEGERKPMCNASCPCQNGANISCVGETLCVSFGYPFCTGVQCDGKVTGNCTGSVGDGGPSH